MQVFDEIGSDERVLGCLLVVSLVVYFRIDQNREAATIPDDCDEPNFFAPPVTDAGAGAIVHDLTIIT